MAEMHAILNVIDNAACNYQLYDNHVFAKDIFVSVYAALPSSSHFHGYNGNTGKRQRNV